MVLFNLFPMCRGNWSPIKLQDKVAVTRKAETLAEVYLDNVLASVISILKGRKWRNMILNRNGRYIIGTERRSLQFQLHK